VVDVVADRRVSLPTGGLATSLAVVTIDTLVRARAVYAVTGLGITSLADLADDTFAEVNFHTLTAPTEVSVKT
jgi:dTDP-4-dehydrorhamnose reductase